MKNIFLTIIFVFLFPIISLAAGWEHSDAGIKYVNDDGTYKTGWYQDVDGKWYYLNDSTGYVLINTITPDGHSVDEAGVWIEKKEDASMRKYENKADFDVYAYEYGSKTIKPFDKTLKVTVHYNNEYMSDGRNLKISGFEVSKDGVLYVKLGMEDPTYYYEIKSVIRYIFEDDTSQDFENRVGSFCPLDGSDVARPLMSYRKKKGGTDPISAEVWITEYEKEQ